MKVKLLIIMMDHFFIPYYRQAQTCKLFFSSSRNTINLLLEGGSIPIELFIHLLEPYIQPCLYKSLKFVKMPYWSRIDWNIFDGSGCWRGSIRENALMCPSLARIYWIGHPIFDLFAGHPVRQCSVSKPTVFLTVSLSVISAVASVDPLFVCCFL